MKPTVVPSPLRKKPGPLPGPPRNRYQVLLDSDIGEWGKQQPGGLSETIRRLLRAARMKLTTG